MSFKALWVAEKGDNLYERSIVKREIEDLPAGELLIRVHYSALNYKDALSASGNKGITKKYPHTPGIDAAGIVEISRSEHFATGDRVVVTGNDLGMNTSGGFAEYIRVPAAWAVPAPSHYSLSECMVIGTAGFTAALSLMKMEFVSRMHPYLLRVQPLLHRLTVQAVLPSNIKTLRKMLSCSVVQWDTKALNTRCRRVQQIKPLR